jgi:Lipocalin-like domain
MPNHADRGGASIDERLIARDAIVGIWRLIDYEDRETEDVPWSRPFGERPVGVGVYHPSGLLSMQLFADPRSDFKDAFVGYVGTFEVEEAETEGNAFFGVLRHHMDVAAPPELLAEESSRPFRVTGRDLTLGDGRTWRRRFTRL